MAFRRASNILIALASVSLTSIALPARAQQSLPISFTYNWSDGLYSLPGESIVDTDSGMGTFTIPLNSNLYSGVTNPSTFSLSLTGTSTTTYPGIPPSTTSQTVNYATGDLNSFSFSVTPGQPATPNLALATNFVTTSGLDPFTSQVAFKVSANAGAGETGELDFQGLGPSGPIGPVAVETGGTVTIDQGSLEAAILQGSVTVGTSYLPYPSLNGKPRSVEASFTPNFGLSLQQAASLLGYTGFDWEQTVFWPTPNLYANSNPSTPLGPVHSDPPPGGYTYQNPPNDDPNLGNPYYYDPNANQSNHYSLVAHITNNSDTLNFADSPENPDLQPGQVESFYTDLVGIEPGGQPGPPLVEFRWQSNYTPDCTTLVDTCIIGPGGAWILVDPIAIASSYIGASYEKTQGTGGITILSETYLNGTSPAVPEVPVWLMLCIGFALLALTRAYRYLGMTNCQRSPIIQL